MDSAAPYSRPRDLLPFSFAVGELEFPEILTTKVSPLFSTPLRVHSFDACHTRCDFGRFLKPRRWWIFRRMGEDALGDSLSSSIDPTCLDPPFCDCATRE